MHILEVRSYSAYCVVAHLSHNLEDKLLLTLMDPNGAAPLGSIKVNCEIGIYLNKAVKQKMHLEKSTETVSE